MQNAKQEKKRKKHPKIWHSFISCLFLTLVDVDVVVVVVASSVLFLFHHSTLLVSFFMSIRLLFTLISLFLCVLHLIPFVVFFFAFHPVSSKSAFGNVNKHSLTMCGVCECVCICTYDCV